MKIVRHDYDPTAGYILLYVESRPHNPVALGPLGRRLGLETEAYAAASILKMDYAAPALAAEFGVELAVVCNAIADYL